MAAGLRKCLDMAPVDPPGGDPEDVRYPGNWDKILATGAQWIRVWINWDIAEPTQGSYDNAYFSIIDEQVLGARARGLRVVLVTRHFPRWSNGTVGLTDADYAGENRKNPSGSLKPFEQKVPWNQLGVGGAWGSWINALMSRYKGYGGIVLEVMNEPNLQMWPQQGGENDNEAGDLIIHQKVAEMMNTAAYLAAYHGFQMNVAGPASSDYRGASNRRATNYWWFLWNLRSALEALNQRGNPPFIWTHHNYKDIEDNNTLGIDLVRSVLVNWWRGWSPTSDPSGANPGFWITEGGARINIVGSEAAQNLLVAAGWNRALANAGAGMFTNYLLHGVPTYNTGLRADVSAGGAPRPVWNTFVSWPGNI